MPPLGPTTSALVLDALQRLAADGLDCLPPVHDFVFDLVLRLELVALRPYPDADVVLLPKGRVVLAAVEILAAPLPATGRD